MNLGKRNAATMAKKEKRENLGMVRVIYIASMRKNEKKR
jgi:hypothetical protein